MNTTMEFATELDIVHARKSGRTLAREQGFSSIDQARFATAMSELARIFFLYSTTVALLTFRSLIDGDQHGIEIRMQGSGSTLVALLAERDSTRFVSELPGGVHRVMGGKQHRSKHQLQVLEHTQEGATILIEQFWWPSR
jgi:anti-sigma regulatory factor (Ser/Thr protein kinase)